MSNRLSMATIHSIETLHRSGHSNREIARLLNLDRGTVNKYVQRLQAASGHEAAGKADGNPHTEPDQDRPGHRPQVGPQTGSVAETRPPELFIP